MTKITAKFPGIKTLVADDYPINLELTKEFLEIMECKVDTAQDGMEALNLSLKNNYDIIFMDIQMPEMDGFEVTAKIRQAEDKKKHTPIIALTANAMSTDREACLKAGMDDYISKPIRSENLVDILNKYFSEKHHAKN